MSSRAPGRSETALVRALEATLHASVLRLEPTRGGNVAAAFVVTLDEGAPAFVKTVPGAPPGLFRAEAQGLDWLRAALRDHCASDELRVPAVRAVGDDPPLLVLEWLTPQQATPATADRLGRGLATLHRVHEARPGFDAPNWVGSVPQTNEPTATWVTFYRERRLLPALRSAQRHGPLPSAVQRDVDRVVERFDVLFGADPPSSRLHGDLWSGNVCVGAVGAPYLVDPAVYAGHREVDLAMMRLFGGFDRRTYDAYDEAYPPEPGAAERVALYQLYPALVHVAMFGASYHGTLARIARIAADTVA